jgi:hypothetical protein
MAHVLRWFARPYLIKGWHPRRRTLVLILVLVTLGPLALGYTTGLWLGFITLPIVFPVSWYVGSEWVLTERIGKDIYGRKVPETCRCGSPLVRAVDTQWDLVYLRCPFWLTPDLIENNHNTFTIGASNTEWRYFGDQ